MSSKTICSCVLCKTTITTNNIDKHHGSKTCINGKLRRFFPDFYLPDYDLYVDPKNKYVISKQLHKLDVTSKHNNIIILNSIEKCQNFLPWECDDLKWVATP